MLVYQGGTLTLAQCFQDIGLAVPGPNPMNTDETGRLPIFYIADGVYKVTLIDPLGITIYDYPQVAAIGASSSGGGGSGVDPTTIFQTGDELWRKIGGARAGWVPQNAKTIGSATSGASERANADCQLLFLYLWNNYPDSKCPVPGGRGARAALDWGINKQITLPDMRGRGPFGLDGMGNARANIIPDTNVDGGETGDTAAAKGGLANQTILKANIPAYNFDRTTLTWAQGVNSLTWSQGVNSLTFSGTQATLTGATNAQRSTAPQFVRADAANVNVPSEAGMGTGTITMDPYTPAGTIGGSITGTIGGSLAGTIGGTIGTGGSGTALKIMPPFVLGTWYIKL